MQTETDETFAELERDVREELGLAPVVQKKKTPSTISSRNAASALSRPSKSVNRLPPVSRNPPAKMNANSALQVRKSRTAAPTISTTARAMSQRFASATAASNSTLGYAQGRAVSQKVRRPITSVFRDTNSAARSASDNHILKEAGDVVERLRMADLGLDEHDNDEDGIFGQDLGMVPGSIDDEFDDFQFPLPTS
jgi:hypothetical protein